MGRPSLASPSRGAFVTLRVSAGGRRRVSAAPVDVDEVDPGTTLASQSADHRAQRSRRATAATDDLAQILGVHTDLKDGTVSKLLVLHGDVVGVVDDAADQVLECVSQHGVQAPAVSELPSVLSTGVSSVGFSSALSASGVLTSSALTSSAFTSAVSALGVSALG